MNYQPYVYGGCSGCEDADINFEVDFPVMQFTGLLDKNGNEIWEGDIIRYLEKENQNSDVRTIEYSDSLARFFPYLGEVSKSDIEVIGNIYQNVDLI